MVTLAGEPNAGKSTLMNELLGRERAIVTDIAGTTRDYLEERCLVNGRLVRLIDTAGIRDGGDKVERLGIERAKQLISESDVTLLLVPADATQAAVDAADRWLLTLKPKSVLKLVTKADLKRPTWASGDWLPVSCKSGDGLNALRQRLAAAVDASVGQLGEAAFITTARHANSLRSAAEALTRYFGADAAKQYEEVLAFELQAAAKALQGIIGDVNSEDVLDKVFGDFCIGK
jgi:tRNA modification GTPase